MKRERPQLVVSDKKGKISSIPHFEPVGMAGGHLFRLTPKDLIKLPHGSELFMMPKRPVVGYERRAGHFVSLDGYLAAAGFSSPGHTTTYNSAYLEKKGTGILPLFSYAALAFYKGEFYIAAKRVDRELRQDLRRMDIAGVRQGVKQLRKAFPANRLMRHLEGCALTYGCPAAKNFFLSRYEAPLPTAPHCNARCIGCISYQPGSCPITQPRIKFIPSADEVAEVALYHIERVKDPVVSFGQGCEGEPLMAAKTLEGAVRIIRRETSKGIINLNTNASKPKVIAGLFDLGLDSIRVSMNSVRREYYVRYYKPRGYGFKDVLTSIRAAKKKGGFVSINYLSMPGFTDTKRESSALNAFISKYGIDMVQWRNLNYDPMMYLKEMRSFPKRGNLIGIDRMIDQIRAAHPRLMHGYFNPSRARMRRAGKAGRRIANE